MSEKLYSIIRTADSGKVNHAWLPVDDTETWWMPVCGSLGQQHITNLYNIPMRRLCQRCRKWAEVKYRKEDAGKP